jgi:hypothetical protein
MAASLDNSFNTNYIGSTLNYEDVSKPSSRCNVYMAQNGIPVENIGKNKMKVMAQFVPSYTYNLETGGTTSHKACTLPESALETYKVNTRGGNYQCYLQNPDSVTVQLATGKTPFDVTKGCAVPFSYDQTKYIDGDVKSTADEVNNMLDNAYQILDYDTLAYIRKLRREVAELTAIRNKLRDVDLPKSISDLTAAQNKYNEVRTECEDVVNVKYPAVMKKIQAESDKINASITSSRNEVDGLRRTLPDYHRDKKLAKIIRNINELSFVTLFWDIMSGFWDPSKKWVDAVKSGNAHVSYTKPTPSLGYRNINRKGEWAGGVREVSFVGGQWNDQTSSLFFPPGMKATLYEHINFGGRSIEPSLPDYPNGLQHGYMLDLRSQGYNDTLSSLRIYGAFNSEYWDDSDTFIKKVNNPFSTGQSARPSPDSIPQPPPPQPTYTRGGSLGDFGGSGGGGFEAVCDNGSYITQFSGRSGSWIDRISGMCSNGKSFGPYGGMGGGPYEFKAEDGFNKLNVAASKRFVDNIQFYSGGNPMGNVGGGSGSSGGGIGGGDLDCGGGKIMGIKGGSGVYVDRLGVICTA